MKWINWNRNWEILKWNINRTQVNRDTIHMQGKYQPLSFSCLYFHSPFPSDLFANLRTWWIWWNLSPSIPTTFRVRSNPCQVFLCLLNLEAHLQTTTVRKQQCWSHWRSAFACSSLNPLLELVWWTQMLLWHCLNQRWSPYKRQCSAQPVSLRPPHFPPPQLSRCIDF